MDSSQLPKDDNNEDEEEAFNVPFNLIVEGSYFGDSDCLFLRKCMRESTAEADLECHLLLLKKHALEELLENYIDIKNQMMCIAIEKRKYHRRLIYELLQKRKRNEINEATIGIHHETLGAKEGMSQST
jgi:CRP-like cAMP-binding protein